MRATFVITRMLALSLAVVATVAAQAPSPQPQPQPQPQSERDQRRGRSEALSEREELAIAGLEGLLSAPPERALPLLRKVLAGSMSDTVKSRALFVLAQIDTPEAQSLLLDTARSTGGPLQREAIRAIGIGGNDAALDSLAGLYQSGDAATRQEVLQAYLIADREDLIFEIAKSTRDEEEFDRAVQLLGAMDATEQLRRLGEVRGGSESLMQAYAIAGDLDSLRRIAAGGGDSAVRAVRSIGIVGNDGARQALRELYRTSADPEVKDAALQGMLIADDEDGVLELYRASTNAEEKKALLRTLSIMGGDAALEAIDAALQGDRT